MRVPYLGRNLGRADTAEGNFWRRIVNGVLRRPALSLVVSVGAMLALASPIFGMHIGANGVSTLPSSLPSKQGYVLLQRSFPAQNPDPVRIVAVGGRCRCRAPRARAARRGSPPSRAASAEGRSRRRLTATSRCSPSPIRGDAVGGAAVGAVRDLRAHLIPSILRRQRGKDLRRRHRPRRTSTTSTP